MFKTSIEQWQLLAAVVEHGSIASAAESHYRSQPAVSYQLTQLQQRLGVELLELRGRRLVLTEAGKALLEQAKLLLDGFQDLELRAEAIRHGRKLVVTLVVDSMFPQSWLFAGLKAFHQRFSQTQVHVKESIKDEGVVQLQQQQGDLYLISLPPTAAVEKQLVMDVQFVCVAHREHPLLQLPAELRRSQLASYPMIQIVDKQSQQLLNHHPSAQECWYFTSIDAAIGAVVNQLGFGWLPQQQVAPLLADGTLASIGVNSRTTQLYFVRGEHSRHDDSVKALSEALLAQIHSNGR
ncbi:LysR family transcriptional regulator [Shewanella avicenniae]|uniref:LysR family transcriptional regulator n=1 Tax=Shewanella avicenniae TaxID=2814294 RepID=A0ABX7QT06_9GAMM|nr:LysR family transcriptional regulator [Shewanella avicenniae]QSX34076.1 LysR family transcriptional regulator [Shewanella avicenniae]